MSTKFVTYGMIIQLFCFQLLLAAEGDAQSIRNVKDVIISVNYNNTPLLEIFNGIEAKTQFKFVYDKEDISIDEQIDLKLNNRSVADVLMEISRVSKLGFRQVNNTINVRKLKNKENEKPIEVLIEKNVSGKVTDGENGEVLPGVNVLAKGTSTGTVTDIDGNYNLTVSDDVNTLVFSSIGYLAEEVTINAQSVIDVALMPDIQSLSEVVVIGYGTVEKSDLTGAVSSLKSEDLNPGANASVDQMMQGRAAGVQIQQSSSEPGGGLSIRVRGASSINASNEPLYVIDGFPIDNSPNLSSSDGGASQVAENQSPRNPLNSLNPNDIESIEILKDASATAIYGSRGANGVILVTTKKGRKDRLTLSYNTYAGIQNVAKEMDILTTDQYIGVINELSMARGNDPVFTESDIAEIGAGTNWQDQIYRSAPITDQNISLSGGNENTTVFASLNYFSQDGVVKNSGMKRYIARVNLESKLGEKVNVGLNLNTSLVSDNNAIDGLNTNENAGPIYTSLLYDPTEPIYNADGTFARSTNLTINNPVSLIKGVSSENKTNRTIGNFFVSYDIMEGLNAKLNAGADRQNSRRDIYNSQETIRGVAAGGIANISELERSNYLIEYTMNYNKSINENHVLTILGGVTYQTFISRLFTANISGFPTDDLGTDNLGLGDTNTDNLSSNHEENTLLSYLGRVNYNLYDKFLFTASVRADGSSRFGQNYKYGYFPSFAVGWKLSEENFIPETFEQLKLRASWGQTGNQEIGNYGSQLTFSTGPDVVFDNTIQNSAEPQRIANPDLKWETTEQFNVGIDASILDGRISGTLDYFSKNTKDLLFNLPLPRSSGYQSILTNVGEVENKGVEFLISAINISSPDFRWSTTANFAAIKNKVLDLGRVNEIVTGDIQAVGNTAIIKKGEALASYYGYEVTGIFQEGDDIDNSAQPNAQPGFPIFADLNEDGAISPADQTILGDPFPDFTFGFQNSFSYKNWQLDMFFQGQQGSELLNINVIESLYPANFRRNRLSEQMLNRWTPQNTDTPWPSGTDPNSYGGSKVNSLVLQDASYIRLKNVQLSYNVPVDNIGFLSSLRVYATGQNLLTWTDYIGFDPEANSFGRSNVRVDYSSYPLARTFLLGLNARF
ncbi:TonB-linked SusC/RagA family outer membrane protein [Catalinimonas alkaloidigena]|uniref:SusC/RagA family TonB-linked outer membrane protein n=1 Tax=Catalinimonas alkaloidigena TaxID=1075417 RepID=UPI002406B657|nr:TonB-dependent receptor [Catalinimonas alkaloidigena]MDF9797911.1 TonB-linked SusC/RagA family outer membrane protein [Catalinimonas alkaloidigena]